MAADPIPVVEVRGTHRQVGQQIGEVTKLTASDAADEDRFGRSVAISGATVVIGAFLADGAGSGSGAAKEPRPVPSCSVYQISGVLKKN